MAVAELTRPDSERDDAHAAYVAECLREADYFTERWLAGRGIGDFMASRFWLSEAWCVNEYGFAAMARGKNIH